MDYKAYSTSILSQFLIDNSHIISCVTVKYEKPLIYTLPLT